MRLTLILVTVAGLAVAQDINTEPPAAAAADDVPAADAPVEGRSSSSSKPRFFVGGNTGGHNPGLLGGGHNNFGLPGAFNQHFGQTAGFNQHFGQSGVFNPNFALGGVHPGFHGQGGLNSHLGGGSFGLGGVGGGVVSSNCRRWCRTPENKVYCCEKGTDQPSLVAHKPGFCPEVRPFCPRFHGAPKTCSNDGSCPGIDKCCFDRCLCEHTCKPPLPFPPNPPKVPGNCRR